MYFQFVLEYTRLISMQVYSIKCAPRIGMDDIVIVCVLFDEEMKSTKTTRSTTTNNNNNTAAAVATAITTTTSSISRPIMSEIEEPVEIKHSYTIGNSRSVYVDSDNDVSIVDDRDIGKRAFFTAQRWVRFVQEISSIDKAVQRAVTYKPTNFQQHIGGQWYVGVSERFQNVDIRRWFIRVGFDSLLRPTTCGISLSFTEWNNLKKIVKQMTEELPQFTAIPPCWHESQRAMESCSECNPTPNPF